MSRADEIFITMCRDILEKGTSTEGEKEWLTDMTYLRNFLL